MDKYIINNKRGCTVTIMVPWDCDNGCAFCVNKCEYKEGFDIDSSMRKILKNIAVMHEITPACDFVITGGEPFANCSLLVDIIEAIPEGHPIYINTTLPVLYKSEIFDFVRKYWYKISGINVSRHIWTPVDGANDKFIKKIGKYVSIRINSVILRTIKPFSIKNNAMIEDFMERFSTYNVQFRADYRGVSLYDVKFFRVHPTFDFLTRAGFEYLDCKEEINRVNVRLNYKGREVHWHLTTDFSKVKNGENYELVDIIINQEGELMDDWNGYGAPLDLEMYRRSVE